MTPSLLLSFELKVSVQHFRRPYRNKNDGGILLSIRNHIKITQLNKYVIKNKTEVFFCGDKISSDPFHPSHERFLQ